MSNQFCTKRPEFDRLSEEEISEAAWTFVTSCISLLRNKNVFTLLNKAKDLHYVENALRDQIDNPFFDFASETYNPLLVLLLMFLQVTQAPLHVVRDMPIRSTQKIRNLGVCVSGYLFGAMSCCDHQFFRKDKPHGIPYVVIGNGFPGRHQKGHY